MKKIILLILCSVVIGCQSGSLGSVKKTTLLHPGMEMQEVREKLGNPTDTSFNDGITTWRYNLHEYWVGFIPYYLAFNADNKLVGWHRNMQEYYAKQAMWLKAFPPTQKVEVKQDIHHSGSTSHDVDVKHSGSITHDVIINRGSNRRIIY